MSAETASLLEHKSVVNLQPVRDPQIPLMDQVVIYAERPGGLTECDVPRHLIDHEEVPVKEGSCLSKPNDQEKLSKRWYWPKKTAIQLW